MFYKTYINTLHDNVLFSQVSQDISRLLKISTLKSKSCHDANFVITVAPHVVITTTCGVASDYKADIVTTSVFIVMDNCQ